MRQPIRDSNRSRWPLHPLWEDLQKQIESFNAQGVYRSIDTDSLLDERLLRIAISIHGYLKQVAAIECIQRRRSMISDEDALKRLYRKMKLIHDPLTWKVDVEKRIDKFRLGQW